MAPPHSCFRGWQNTSHVALVLVSVLLLSSARLSVGGRSLLELYKPPASALLTYHNGAVLQGRIPVSIIWYGRFTPAQKAVVTDFLQSLTTASPTTPSPSVSQWWNTINRLYLSKARTSGSSGARSGSAQVALAGQVTDEGCSLGKRLTLAQLPQLAARAGTKKGGIALVLTAQDVAVDGFCMSLAAREREHAPRSRSHVPRSGDIYVPETRMFPFPRVKMIPMFPFPYPFREREQEQEHGCYVHEPLRPARLGRQRRDRLRLGRQLRHAVPRPVRVAVPPAAVRAPGAGARAAQRRRRHGRYGDQHRQHGRRHGDQPVPRRVLPGRQGRTAGGRHGLHRGLWQRRLPRFRRQPGGGPHDGGELQRQWCEWEEIPASRSVRPCNLYMFHFGVTAIETIQSELCM